MFQTADGDTVRRSWTSWTRRPGPQGNQPRHNWEESFAAVPPRGRRPVRPAAVPGDRCDQPGGHDHGRGAGAWPSHGEVIG